MTDDIETEKRERESQIDKEREREGGREVGERASESEQI